MPGRIEAKRPQISVEKPGVHLSDDGIADEDREPCMPEILHQKSVPAEREKIPHEVEFAGSVARSCQQPAELSVGADEDDLAVERVGHRAAAVREQHAPPDTLKGVVFGPGAVPYSTILMPMLSRAETSDTGVESTWQAVSAENRRYVAARGFMQPPQACRAVGRTVDSAMASDSCTSADTDSARMLAGGTDVAPVWGREDSHQQRGMRCPR
ncbi:hypothetical protein [Candidatus Palauibacter sp.]|uniref:hypothetical protein n=1 Tax=Candidatus Palauibacter sp. TaxID=3101350 RepID=UPI003AF2B256